MLQNAKACVKNKFLVPLFIFSCHMFFIKKYVTAIMGMPHYRLYLLLTSAGVSCFAMGMTDYKPGSSNVLYSENAKAKKLLYISDYGATPGDGHNTMIAVRKALLENRDTEQLILVFPKGRYDFYPDSATGEKTGIVMKGLKDVTIDGRGSSFVFHSEMSGVVIEGCENIRLYDFSIDWDRPYISQGKIVGAGKDFVDIKIDKNEYPYQVQKGKILFNGEGWSLGVALHNLYDDNKDIVYKTHDNPLGNVFFDSQAEELGNDVVRFHTTTVYKPQSGTYIAMLHARYLTSCIQVLKSRDVSLKNINIYHSLSMGVVAFKSEGLILDNVNVKANEEKGRVFSAIADAFHFSTCRGKIEITNCTHSGQADDFVNVHGEYIPVDKRIDNYSVVLPNRSKLRNVNALIEAGEEIWFVDSFTSQRSAAYRVVWLQAIQEETYRGYRLTVDRELPKQLGPHFYIESKTWNPSLLVRQCSVLKKNRARGILVTTPEKVVIENNYFNTAGAAILIEGDLNYWFESGGVKNVKIKNNVFENCVTSGRHWGHSIITIIPSFKPADQSAKPYHHNVKISNNLFKHFDQGVLAARSVGNLIFTHNKIVKTSTFSPYSNVSVFSLNGCKNVKIESNTISKDFGQTTVELKNMAQSDLQSDDKNMIIRN